MIKCIAIDDEPLALQQISSYIQRTPFLEQIALCQSAFEALDILANTQVDLLFVDINMPDLNGLDFVKSLTQKPFIIFTTAYSEYALEGFKVDATDYILKPIGYEDFLKAVNKVKARIQSVSETDDKMSTSNDSLFVKSDYKLIRINLTDIKYIESANEYVQIHIEDEKPITTLIRLKNMEEQLPKSRFMRVHRSFIVNLDKVKVIDRNRIVFDKVYIPVGDQYKDAFQAFIDKTFLV
jgi:two-component system LytT family response regulator